MSTETAEWAPSSGVGLDYMWAHAELARYTYKPNYTLAVVFESTPEWGGTGIYLAGTFHAPDSRHTPPDAPPDWPVIRLNFKVPVPEFAIEHHDSDYFAVWLREVLHKIELHESDEWLRRDGCLLNDPHDPLARYAPTKPTDMLKGINL